MLTASAVAWPTDRSSRVICRTGRRTSWGRPGRFALTELALGHKHAGNTLYLARETKGTRDFLKLRTSEADKVRCGTKHFDSLGIPFEVVSSADDV